ncbi:MAG: alkaline phosphatase family protein [Thermoanaerobaculia bacterium]
MRRHRFLNTLMIFAGFGVILYVLISLFVSSPRRLIFGVDKQNGAIRRAEQGIVFLPPHQYYRLNFERRNGLAAHEGIAVVRSQEGVPIRLTYHLRFDVDQDQMPDSRRLVREGWSAWIRARVSEAITALLSRIPVETLVSPTNPAGSHRELVRRTVTSHLAQSGLTVSSFEIERMEIDRDALLRYKRGELRRNARAPGGRVAILGLEAADWQLIRELINDDRMPNIASLIDAGTTAVVQPVRPTLAPLAWTTLATGLPPDRHGVLDYVQPGSATPVESRTRRAPAIWDIAQAFGRQSLVVSWWASWPPVRPGLTQFDLPMVLEPKAVHPPEAAEVIAPLLISENEIRFEDMQRFLNVTETEFQQAIGSNDPNDPIRMLRSTLAKTWSDHRAALALFEKQTPALTMVLFSGTDTVNHLFSPYHPPKRQVVPMEDYRRYWPTVAAYYSEIDRLVGEWIRVLPTDTTLLVVSPYGMDWAEGRPVARPAGESQLAEHRGNGVLIAFGNRVDPSRARRAINVIDIAPTVLSLLGLPVSREMPGTFQPWLANEVEPVQSVQVTSYGLLLEPKLVSVDVESDPDSYRAYLQAIGHFVDPNRSTMPALQPDEQAETVAMGSPQWGSYAHNNNLGVQLHREGKTAEAIRALEEAIGLNSGRPTAYLNLAIVYLSVERHTDAEDVYFEGIARGAENPVDLITGFAAWHRENGNPTRAVSALQRGSVLFPDSAEISANLGSAYASVQRYTDATAELERALTISPSSTLVLNNLGQISVQRKDYGQALDYWSRSLALNGAQPRIREGIEALRTRI